MREVRRPQERKDMDGNVDILDMTSAGQVCLALADMGNDLVKLNYIAGLIGLDGTAILEALDAVAKARDEAYKAYKEAN